jgi:RNA polymerase sigma-54 factor
MLLQSQTHSLRPLTTAHLAQTMTLLELTAAELSQKIEAELATNPALELADQVRCPHCHRRLAQPGLCPACSRPPNASDQPIVFLSPREDFRNFSDRLTGEDLPDDNLMVAEEDLPAYVLRQIATELAAEDRQLAAHILTSLNEDGLLTVTLFEIARFHHVPLSRVENVLQLIQRCDPVGVGSETPQQALLVQLEVLSETRPVPPLAFRAVKEGMDLLSRRAYPELARLLGVTTAQAAYIARFISDNLNPFPGRAHWGENHDSPESNPTYHNPDVIISCLTQSPETQLVVEIVAPYAGALRINPLFREALAQAPSDKIEQWQAHLEQAGLLIKCIQQRNHTIVRLLQRLVVLQRKFILYGDAHLSPVTRASLAVELEVHESTVSRAVSGKAVQLPNGRIVPLSKLFDRSLHIRTALIQIISQETVPLSDTHIADMLVKKGFPVARRTVAKYRSMEGILPARFRQPRPAFTAK